MCILCTFLFSILDYKMGFTIVYKTYLSDLKWLKYSLISVDKFVKDIDEIIIYYHDVCYKELDEILQLITLKYPFRLIPVNYDIHGYLKQMVVKCMAFKDVKTDYIVFIDSDIIFKEDFSPKNRISDDNKINWSILKKNSSNSSIHEWRVWGPAVMKMTNEEMTTYYMYNGFPFIVRKDTLEKAYDKFVELHKMDYLSFCKFYLDKLNIIPSMPIIGPTGKFIEMASIFEEFEYMGWFAQSFTNDYNFIIEQRDTCYCIQYWSHEGLNENTENTIKSILDIQ